jgi:hypothetical protein
MAAGGASGYLTVNPTQDYVGQAVRGVENGIAQVRAEKYQKERDQLAADQNEQQQRRSDFKDSQEFSAKYPFIATGNTNLDSKNKQDLETGKMAYSEAMDGYYKTGDKSYMAKADSILGSINEATEMPKALALTVESWIKNEADLNPSSLSNKKGFIEKMKTDLVRDYDATGRSVYSMANRDADGNVTGMKFQNITGEQLKKYLNVEPKFEVTGEKGLVAQYTKSIGKQITTTNVVNGMEITTIETPGAAGMAKTMAKEATQSHSAVYSALEQLGIDPENEANYKDEKVLEKVQDHYETLLAANAPKTESSKKNYDEKEYQMKVQGVNISLGNLSVSQATAKLAKLKFEYENNTTKTSTTTNKLNAKGIKLNAEYKKQHEGEEIPMYVAEFGGGVDKVTVSSSVKKNAPKPQAKPTETAAARAKRIANGG